MIRHDLEWGTSDEEEGYEDEDDEDDEEGDLEGADPEDIAVADLAVQALPSGYVVSTPSDDEEE
jgi:hypothetical protein